MFFINVLEYNFMTKTIEEFKDKGVPVKVPGGDIKGWEIGDDFMINPDYVAPPPAPVETIEPIKIKCGKCGADEAKEKIIEFKGGLTREVSVCDKCIKYYG